MENDECNKNDAHNIIIICFDSYIILYSFVGIFVILKYLGLSNKINILQLEKYVILSLFFIAHIIRRATIIFENHDDCHKIPPSKLFSIFIDVYLKTVFMFNFSISLFLYKNIVGPTHLLHSIIKKPFHVMYEISILIVTGISIVIAFFLEKTIPYEIIDELKICQILGIGYLAFFGLINILDLIIIIKTLRLLEKYSFLSKEKIASYLKGNLVVCFLYLIIPLIEIILFIYEKAESATYQTIFQYTLEVISLIDVHILFYQIYCSDCYLYKISKKKGRLFFWIFKCLMPDFHNSQIITDSISEIGNKNEAHKEVLVSSGFEKLEQFLQQNNYNIDSYNIELLDYIINTSLASICLAYNKKGETEKDEYLFLKTKFHNDFKEDQAVNTLIESTRVNVDKLNVSIISYFNQSISNMLSIREISIDTIKNSIMPQYIEETNQFKSILRKNIIEEDFKNFKTLVLKSCDKQICIEIYPNFITDSPQQKINVALKNYINHLNKYQETFLPLVLGVYKVKINDFDDLLFILTENSLNEGTVTNNLNNYYHLFQLNYPSADPLKNIKDENNILQERENEIKMNEIDLFNSVLKRDLQLLSSLNINTFGLNVLYYQPRSLGNDQDGLVFQRKEAFQTFSFLKYFTVSYGPRLFVFYFQFCRVFDQENYRFCSFSYTIQVEEIRKKIISYFCGV